MLSSASALKILVSGDVEGKFSQLFSRVSAVNKKNGPFEMLLCVGNFFGEDNTQWDEYMNGTKKAPITTYVLGPAKSEHETLFPAQDGCELCHNITYLGKKGILTGSSGLKVAYLSGTESSGKQELQKTCEFNEQDVESVHGPVSKGSENGVDILLTSEWPKGITNYAGSPKGLDVKDVGSELVSQLAFYVRPRYHFAGLHGIYYERLPYRNHKVLAELARHPTRFISLANVGNVQKDKWLYAFSITPMSAMDKINLVKQPLDVTECPFKFSKEDLSTSEKPTQQFFYDLKTETGGQKRHRGERNEDQKTKKPRQTFQPQGPCWFCLSSSEVEKHLVVSVGDHNYLALAKRIVQICIPNYHITESSFKCEEKLQRVRKCSGDQLSLQIVSPGMPYFYVELENGEKLFNRIKKDFPLQFGREVLACESLLNMPQRIEWKACSVSKEKETHMAEEFRKDFEEFDFTLA
ncbi:CWF19-like protein 1 [Tachypleus tridentatus]|uniref:CWF19-like protein 1 n=1 Tax=Tachypleus tridentatus TaxID=6853 RepID=UPI003FD69742